MIYFDIDGVLRNLCGIHSGVTESWVTEVQGMKLMEYMHTFPQAIANSSPTPLLKVIKQNRKQMTLISCQPVALRQYTDEWIHRHLKGIDVTTIYTCESGDCKLQFLKSRDVIIEDYPFFSNYSRVILIDYPYNRNVKNPMCRVTSPQQMENVLYALDQAA